MKFSIIICTYNSIGSLSRALDSILSQSHDDFEVVIIDGASTDSTLEIIKDYENKFAGKLRWISENDAGIYDAMNKGIDLAVGDYLYFLGSDDLLHDASVLGKVSKKIGEGEWDVVYGDVLLGDTGEVYAGEFSKAKLIETNICHQAIFFRKNIFEKLGKYEPRYIAFADWVFNMKWFNSPDIKHAYIDMVIAQYALGGHSRRFFDKNFYMDFEGLVKHNFPKDCMADFYKKKYPEMRFVRNYYLWRLWEFKNKVKFAIFRPKQFIQKYIKRLMG